MLKQNKITAEISEEAFNRVLEQIKELSENHNYDRKATIKSIMFFINLHYKKKIELMSQIELNEITENFFNNILK